MKSRKVCSLESLERRNLLATVHSADFSELEYSTSEYRISIRFDDQVVGAGLPTNYSLQLSGSDGIFGSTDPTATPNRIEVNGPIADLYFSGRLEPDLFRLTVKDGITDIFGRRIDGDQDGLPGGDWITSQLVTNAGKFSFDSTFNDNGTFRLDLNGFEAAHKITVQDDGKYFVSGIYQSSTSNHALLARFNANGKLDRSFNQTGFLIDDIGRHGHSSTVPSTDGGYVVKIDTQDFPEGFRLRKFKTDGTRDTTFGVNGEATVRANILASLPQLDVTSEGKMLVTGTNRSQTNAVVIGLNSNGTLDSNFGVDGILIKPLSSNLTNEYGRFSKVLNDSRFIMVSKVVQSTYSHTTQKLVLTVYDKHGVPDASFGKNGSVDVVPEPNVSDLKDFNPSTISVDSEHRILLGSEITYKTNSGSGYEPNVSLTRILPNGKIDTSFGEQGHLILDRDGNGYETITNISADRDGKILVSVFAWGGSYGMHLMRFNPDGSSDVSFGTNGTFIVDRSRFGVTQIFPNSVHPQLVSGTITDDGGLLFAGLLDYPSPTNAWVADLIVTKFNFGNPLIKLENQKGDEFTFTPQGLGSGQLLNGESSLLNRLTVGANLISTDAHAYEDNNQTVTLTNSAGGSQLQFVRSLTVPWSGRDSFLQTIDTFQNPGPTTVETMAVFTSATLNNSKLKVFATSDGDLLVEPTDFWIGIDDNNPNGGLEPFVQIFRSDFVPQATTALSTREETGWQFPLQVQPGASISLATFTVRGRSRQQAIESARHILTYDSENTALQFLTPAEADEIVNFRFNFKPEEIQLSTDSIVENSPIGSVVATLSAIDRNLPQGDEIVFSLDRSNGEFDNNAFQIVGNQLITNTTLDFETKSSFTISVSATDRAGCKFVKTFQIKVINESELRDIALSNDKILASASLETEVGRFSASEVAAQDLIEYSLISGVGDSDNWRFRIVNDSIVTSSSLSAFTDQSADVSVRVRATNQNDSSIEKIFAIHILNTRNAPEDILLSNNTVREQNNNTIVGDFTSIDLDDGDVFRYELVAGSGSGDNPNFQIAGSKLILTNFEDIDKSRLYIRVRSTDRYGFSLEKSFIVYVLPFVYDDSYQTSYSQSIILDVTQNDLKVADFHVELIQPEATSAGRFRVVDQNNVEFIPAQGFVGVGQIEYRLVDSQGLESERGQVRMAVSKSHRQNAWNPLDVNNNGRVTPVDALSVINVLNLRGATEGDGSPTQSQSLFIDVNGDSHTSPTDALIVINHLNQNSGASSESAGWILDYDTEPDTYSIRREKRRGLIR